MIRQPRSEENMLAKWKKPFPQVRQSKRHDAIVYNDMESPIGTVYVALNGCGVVDISFTAPDEDTFCSGVLSRMPGPIERSISRTKPVMRELREYFDGKRTEFSFPPVISGMTEFQRFVLKAASGIPYGQTRAYGWLASEAGSPRAARAAGQVMANNPVPIIIPCHRVVGSSGNLCGFAGRLRALDTKKWLLELEGIRF